MSHDYFTEIINPSDPSGPKVKAVIPHRLILRYYKYFPVRYENLRAAKYVLDHTKRILAGVRRYNEGGWCFTGRPSIWYTKENVEVGFPQDFVFAVYLNDRFVVYEVEQKLLLWMTSTAQRIGKTASKDWYGKALPK